MSITGNHLDTRILKSLLVRDSFDSTYKFALLRALVQCVNDQRSHKRVSANIFSDDDAGEGSGSGPPAGRAEPGGPLPHRPDLQQAGYLLTYPLGLLVYYWVLYYYPIFAYPVFIPQKNGETPELRPGSTIAFRREFNAVIAWYRHRGGLQRFRYDLVHDSVPEEISTSVLALLRKVQKTIINMPMKHLGVSVFGRHYCLINARAGRITGASYAGLIAGAGSFYIREELNEVLDQLGTLLIGDDSIIYAWADFTYRAARRTAGHPDIDRSEIISLLGEAVDIPRDVAQLRKLLDAARRDGLTCVWSGSGLGTSMHIDHALPFSVWQNNNLWNLFPVTGAVNQRKSNRIPTPDLIGKSAERISTVWDMYAAKYDEQFWQEMFEGLGSTRKDGNRSGIDALKNLSQHLIGTRGYQGFEG